MRKKGSIYWDSLTPAFLGHQSWRATMLPIQRCHVQIAHILQFLIVSPACGSHFFLSPKRAELLQKFYNGTTLARSETLNPKPKRPLRPPNLISHWQLWLASGTEFCHGDQVPLRGWIPAIENDSSPRLKVAQSETETESNLISPETLLID